MDLEQQELDLQNASIMGCPQSNNSFSAVTRREDHEVQEGITITEAGGSLSSFLSLCKKNLMNPKHHSQFISVDSFGPDNLGPLPTDFSLTKEDVILYIMAWVPLVVRLHGHIISDQRPDKWIDDKSPYLFSEYKGRNVNNIGSGWIQWVFGPIIGKCQCPECLLSSSPKEKYWNFHLHTARHVIFDNVEAQQCKVVFFDDEDDSSGAKTIGGWTSHRANTEHDWNRLVCYTHDEDLAKKLSEAMHQCVEVNKYIGAKMTGNGADTGIVAVISHPHGRKKYISIGQNKGDEHMAVKYTNVTCSGCSGGLVLDVRNIDARLDDIPWRVQHLHSGALNSDLGISANWWTGWN